MKREVMAAYSSFSFDPSSLLILAFRASAASVNASIIFAGRLTRQRTFQSAVLELFFTGWADFPQ